MEIKREKVNHDFAEGGRRARALLQQDRANIASTYQRQNSALVNEIGLSDTEFFDEQRRKQLNDAYERYMVTLGKLNLYGLDTSNDRDMMRGAIDSAIDFQNQFKDESDFNVSYAYPQKYKASSRSRKDVNAALTQLKNTPGSEAEYDWLNQNQMGYWSVDDLNDAIKQRQAELDALNQEWKRKGYNWKPMTRTDAYSVSDSAATDQDDLYQRRKAKQAEIADLQQRVQRRAYSDETDKWDSGMQQAFSDYGKALSVDEDARMESAMAGNSAFVVQNSDYATNARNTVRDFEKRLRDYGYSDEQINGMRNWALTQQHANEAAQTAQQVAQEAKEHPWMSSALSVGTSMMSGAGVLNIAAQNLLNGTDPFTGQKTAVDRYSKAMMPSSVTNTIRGSISEDMSGVGSFLYNTGMSMADSLATLAIGGATGLHGAADVILGGAAASQAITDAYDRGATDKQALALGVLYGTAEALFEHVSLDKLRAFHTASAAGQKTIKTLTQNILKQSFVEGSEEVCTDIANVISDAIVMADKSEINQSIAQYEADGMSEEEATRKAWLDWLGQTGLDFAGGALSGGVMTGADAAVTAGMRSAGYAEAGRQITANDYADILRRTAEESGDENLKKLAGKSATNRNTGKLYEATQDANLTKAVSDRMRALGAENGDVQALSAIVVKQIKGQELTGKEQRAFDASKQARRTANEYTSLFTREADQTTNAWARAAVRDAGELRRNALDGAARRTDSSSAELHRAEKNAAVEVDGEQMQVQELRYNAESERAELTVKSENGSVKQISTQDESLPDGTRLLAQSAEKYGQTAPQMYAAYQAGQDVERYASAYEVAYAYGHAGVKNYDVLENSGAASYLTPEQRKFAYETGRNAAKAESTTKDAASRSGNISAGSVTLKGGTLGGVRLAAVNTAGLTSKQRASIDVARKVAQAVGVNVVFYESKADSSGRYIGANGAYRDGTVYLDVNAGKNSVSAGETAILKTMSHELTHFIQQNSGQYEALKAFVAEHVLESGDSIERLAQQKLDNDTTGELTMDGAMDEVVADACEMMLRDSEAVQRLAKENRSLAEKIRDWISDFAEKVRAAFAGDRATHAEARAMLDRMDALQRLWDDALVDAAKANAAKENTAGDGGVDTQYSIDRNFSSAIDAWNGVDNTVFRVGETSDALREIGVQGRPIVWYGGKIAKILRQHSSMTRAIIKQVPEILEHPVVILKSKSSESRLAIFGEVRDTSGAPVTAILELQPTNRGGELLDMNVIASAYGKDSSPARFIQSSGLVYLDPNKNRTDRWLRAVGLRLPSVARASYGSVGSVTYQGGKVKIESVPFAQYMQASEKRDMKNPGGSQNQRGVKEKFSLRDSAGNALTTEQQEFFKDSQVRDDDGRLKVMYRGGNSDFTVFDRKKSKPSNLYGRGFYFTDSESHARQYGNASAFYLNIQHPVSTTKTTITRTQMRKFIDAVAANEDDFSFANYGYGATVSSVLNSVYGKSDFAMLYDVDQTAIGDMVAAVELFNEVNGTNYDGLILDTETVAFRSNQIKNTTNKAPTSDADIRYSEREYTYEALTAKPDMRVTKVDDSVSYRPTREARKEIVARAITNAKKIGRTNENGNAVVRVADTGDEVILSAKGLRHGLDRRFSVNAPVTLKAGEIIRNAIRINEFTPENAQMDASYALIGAAKNAKNEPHIVQFVVNRYSNEVSSIDVLYAVNAKKEPAALLPDVTSTDVPAILTDSAISIRSLLDYVNRYFPDVLPESVLRHYNHDRRPEGKLGESALYQRRDNTRTERDILADATDGDANTVREMEMLREYKEKLGRYTALTQRLEQQRELAQTAENKDERLRAKNRADNLAAQVSRADEQLTRMQRMEALRTLVAREMKTADSLAKENAALRDRVEYWRGQTRRTKEATTDSRAVEKAARSLIRQTSSNLDVDEVAPRLQELYDGITRGGGEVRYSDIRAQAEAIAHDIVSDATAVDDTQYQEYKGLRDYLKRQELVVSEAVKGEIADYADFRKRNMGRMRLKSGETTNIDRVYSELSEMYPEFFDQNRESQPSDQLQRMADVLDAVYSVQEYNPNGRYLREATQSVSNEILEQFFDLPQQKTFADRQAKKLAQQKAEGQNRLNELREAQNAKLQALREQNRQRLADAVARERAKRDEQIARLKEHNAADRARREESEAVAKYRPRIERKARALSDWLLKNSDKEHIPEPLKLPVGEFLSAIDFTSKRALDGGEPTAKDAQRAARYGKRLQNLLDSLRQQSESGVSDMGAYLDIPDGFLDEMQTHIKIANGILEQNPGESPVMMMNGEQLRQLDYLLTVLTKSIQNANKLKANAHFETARQAAQATITQMEKLGEAKGRSSKANKLDAFFQWDNTTPYYAFDRFGEGGKAVFESLADGWDKMAFNTKQVMDFTEKAYTAKEVKAWAKETHDIQLESGKTARMTTAQMMAFYCLSKREQARGHMLGGGVRIGNIEDSGRKGNIRQANPYLLTEKDIVAVNSALTQRQREVADTLQKYMTEQGSTWGNRVSMERFGYRAFTEENYFPIETLDSNRDAKNPGEKENDMFRLLNLSATKSLVYKANNALVVRDIFDVFSSHMADMAKYDALALPLLDAMKWYNYRETQKHSNGQVETTTVQRSLERAYGLDANKYFTTFIQDLNGVNEGGRGEGFARKMLSNYKVAAVGANLRVALLQPTAYVRAVGVMDAKYLMKGLGAKSAYKEAEVHSGIALWKQMGFYDTNIGRNIRSQIKQESTARDTVAEKAMTLAEWGDRLTWGTLWNACKAEVKDKQHLTGDALMEATAKRFREVVYATQVVDSTMTRSQAMRTKGVYSSVATAFMSEPTLSYNLVLKAYTDYTTELRETGNRAQAWNNAKGKIMRALATYLVSAAASGLVESIIDACRDDDEYATWWQKYLTSLLGAQYEDGELAGFKVLDSNLFSDVDVLSKLPILKDFMSMVGGYSNDRMDTEWISNLIDAYRIWNETIKLSTGKQDAPTDVTYNGNMTLYGKIYKTLKAVSQTVGMPVSAAAREVVTIWNNTVGMVTGKTIRTYDAGAESQIKRAVTDGYLTREKAQELLVERGIAEDEDDAYWKVDKWATGEGKFDTALAAVLDGDRAAYDAETKELEAHGVGKKALESSVRSQVKEWYQGDEGGKRTITKDQALKMLQQYGGKDAGEAQKLVQQWTCKVVTGTDYDDILTEYTDGNLTASRAVDMWMRYGGMEREDAENKIATADFVRKHPECDGISAAAVQRYNEQAQPAGVDTGTFWKAWQYKNEAKSDYDENGKSIKGQSAQDKVVAYIDSLPVSAAQKDALFLCFYSQKTLSKIRWSN